MVSLNRNKGKAQTESRSPLLMTLKDIASAFQVTTEAVKKWGLLPHDKIGKSPLYDIRDAISYRFKEKSEEDLTLAEEQKKFMAKRRERLQLQIDEVNGELVRIAEVEALWSEQLSFFRAGLEALPATAARRICAMFGLTEQVKVETILIEEKDEALGKLSSFGTEK